MYLTLSVHNATQHQFPTLRLLYLLTVHSMSSNSSSQSIHQQILYKQSAYQPTHKHIFPDILLVITIKSHRYYLCIYFMIEYILYGTIKYNNQLYNNTDNHIHTYAWEVATLVCMMLFEMLRIPLCINGISRRNNIMLLYNTIYSIILLVGYIYYSTYTVVTVPIEQVINGISIASIIVQIILSLCTVVYILKERVI